MKPIVKKCLFWIGISVAVICLLVLATQHIIKNPEHDVIGEETTGRIILLDNEFSVFDVAMDFVTNQIGYADKERLVITNEYGEVVRKLAYADPFYELIAYDPGAQKWWGFDSITHTFHTFSSEGDFIEVITPQITDILAIDIFKVHDDHYLLLAGESQQHEGRIWIYDLEEATVSQYEPNAMVMSILLTDNNMIVALLSSSSGLYVERYNLDTQSAIGQIELNTYFAASIGIDPNGLLYYSTNRSLYRASETDQVLVGHLPASAEAVYSELGMRIFPTVDGCYVWINGENSLSYIAFSQDEVENQALVVDASFYVPAAMTVFEKTGNHVDFRDRGIASTEQYLTLMLSQDSSVDVYMLRSYNGAEAQSIIEKGFYEDLNQSEIIRSDAKTWFDRLYQDSSFDNKLFGYPYGVSFQMLSYKPDELKKLGLALPRGQMTWHELLDLLEPYSGQKPFPLIINPTQLTQLILWQAYSAPTAATFNDAIGEALSVLDRCKEMGMYDLSPSEYMRSYQFIDNYAMKIDINTLGGINNYPFIPVPSLKSSPCGTPIWYDWLLINPYSNRKQKAFEFIEAHSQAHTEGGMQWSAVLSPTSEFYPRFSEEWLTNYQDIMENSSAYMAYVLENDFIEICNKYLEGQITQVDAISQVIGKYTIAKHE